MWSTLDVFTVAKRDIMKRRIGVTVHSVYRGLLCNCVLHVQVVYKFDGKYGCNCTLL